MSRPFLQYSIDQLEAEYERAQSANDAQALRDLAHELTFRKTPRARELRSVVESAAGGQPAANRTKGRRSTSNQPAATAAGSSVRANGSRPRPARNASTGTRGPQFPPTGEQVDAIDKFRTGGTLKINAYAGTGKTSTLEHLAHNSPKRGQYIAFNKSIVEEAKQRFPDTVTCSTSHSLAFRATPTKYKNSGEKMMGRMNANKLADILKLKKWRIDKNHTLQPRSLGYLILETTRRFSHSADIEPNETHIPRHGALISVPEETMKAVTEFAVNGAKHLWGRMQDPDDDIPLGHDGYLKMWAQTNPVIAAEFILLDEAQDTNPVVLDVLRKQNAQMIYVGDKYQQIYEWRGAVNAMEMIATDHTTYLTTSFRFGGEIAEAATSVLKLLGENRPIKGNPKVASRITPVKFPRTILARTNAATMTAIIECLDEGKQPHLVGDKKELMEMLRGVQDLKERHPSDVPEFFGFENWDQVVDFAKSGEASTQLLTFVNLVQARGEKQLMWALNRTVDAERADITISTAHKAKGREWTTVRLMDDFMRSQPGKRNGSPKSLSEQDPSELRLFYVALTRAKEAVEVPPPLLELMGRPVSSDVRAASRATIPNQARAATSSTAHGARQNFGYKTEQQRRPALQPWQPPRDWRAETKSDRPLPPSGPKNVERAPEPKRGLLDWLFGD